MMAKRRKEKVASFLSWHLAMARRRKQEVASFFHKLGS
jgi:hypothetical protein